MIDWGKPIEYRVYDYDYDDDTGWLTGTRVTDKAQEILPAWAYEPGLEYIKPINNDYLVYCIPPDQTEIANGMRVLQVRNKEV
jgi:hypothetical protein